MNNIWHHNQSDVKISAAMPVNILIHRYINLLVLYNKFTLQNIIVLKELYVIFYAHESTVFKHHDSFKYIIKNLLI